MKSFWLITLAVCAALLYSGCAPKLDQTPYSPKEQEWIKYLKQCYVSWEPPQTVPPIASVESPEAVEIEKTNIVIKAEEPVSKELPPLAMEPEEKKGPVLPAVGAQGQTYVVQKGDSLWKIAKKFYQDGSKWRRIQEANLDKLENPRNLKIGMELKIPPQ